MENKYLGIGLYDLTDAARLLQVERAKVRRWIHGYRSYPPLFHSDFPELIQDDIVTFTDLMELRLISAFRRYGVSLQTIRLAAIRASQLFDTTHPFAVKRFHTDGKTVFAEEEMRKTGEELPDTFFEDMTRSQYALDYVQDFFIDRVDYKDDVALHYWPLGKEKGIVLDPWRSFGKPILDAFGTPTFPLGQMALAGESPERIAWWYEIRNVEAVREAVDFELGELGLRKAA